MKAFLDYTGTRVAPALVSFAILLIFVFPFSRNIANLGNIFGTAVSAAAFAAFVFWKPFKALLRGLWDKPAGKVMLCAAAGFAAVCVAGALITSAFMVKAIRNSPGGGDTTVIVLGCKVKNGAPSLMLKKRLDAAYDFLNDNPEAKVVVSGGKGDDETVSEAECMKSYLASRGISADRIYTEDKSVNTEENLRFSKAIVEREGLPEKITIVTDGYHQFRAQSIAKDMGMDCSGVSADTSWYLVPTYWTREIFGATYYTLFKR